MPINVYGSTSTNKPKTKLGTSMFDQKLCLRTNYIESNFEQSIDTKKDFKIENLQPLLYPRRPLQSAIYIVGLTIQVY